MKQQEVIDWALKNGFTKDRYDHLTKTETDGRRYRLKVSQTAVRLESRVGSSWVRLRSNYLKQLSISPDGKELEGLQSFGCVSKKDAAEMKAKKAEKDAARLAASQAPGGSIWMAKLGWAWQPLKIPATETHAGGIPRYIKREHECVADGPIPFDKEAHKAYSARWKAKKIEMGNMVAELEAKGV